MRTQRLRAALLAVVAGAGLVVAGVPPAVSRAASTVAAPHVRLSQHSGPPTSVVRVSGAGFGAYRAVDIYFDTTDEALVSTNGNGAFFGIPVRVPASAVPGTHYITAVQRHSGRSAQARFLVNANWAQFRHSPSHTGFNRYENVLSRSSVAGLGLRWSFPNGQFFSSPAVAGGVVYTGGVSALNAATGAKLWSSTGVITRGSSPAVAKGVVYIGAQDGNVYALNASTGAQLWATSVGEVFASPAVAGGVVYVGDQQFGTVDALNAATGAELWSFSTGGDVSSSPAVVGGVVYVGSDDGNLYALNASTGAKLWRFPTGGAVDSSPAVANGAVYFAAFNSVYALNASTGAKLWRFPTSHGLNFASPAVAAGVVYISDGGPDLLALNAATGAKKWGFTAGGGIGSSPALANGVVYIGSGDNNLYALDASTGTELWRFTTAADVGGSPAVANGMVYVNANGTVDAFAVPGRAPAISRPTAGHLHPNYTLPPQKGTRS